MVDGEVWCGGGGRVDEESDMRKREYLEDLFCLADGDEGESCENYGPFLRTGYLFGK